MSILTATNISQSFGALDLFSGISVSIPLDAKTGIVGPNGVGKTTLLLILAGLSQPSTGTVRRSRGYRVGYLPQESAQAFASRTHSVYEEMLSAFDALRTDEARLREMEAQISRGGADGESLDRYSALQLRFELAGGYEYETRIRQVLGGLGFGGSEGDLPLPHLSGGQKTRALLARLLLDAPDLLFLDEPTNHLDVPAIEWLEGTLAAWPGAVLVVSHDRYFLDRVVDTVWEMRPTGMEVYRGNYSAYVGQRAERWERRQKEFRALKERLDKEIDFVRRNIAGQRTQMAQGRLARLSREVEALRAGGLGALHAINSKGWLQATAQLDMERPSTSPDEVGRRISELVLPPSGHPEIKLDLTPAKRGGDFVLRTNGLEIGFPDKGLFVTDEIQLVRGECAALMGGNGTGKTTFLRTLLGQLEPRAGELRVGANVEFGYLAQAHDELDEDKTVLDELLTFRNMPPGEARGYLAQFLFHKDDVFKKIAALSGGERSRLALAMLALRRANFLLLDEPTNHLDIPAQEVLQAVLEAFAGTVLLVSHDRYLIDRLASQVWELDDGRLRVFPGPYRALLAERARTREQPQSDGPDPGSIAVRAQPHSGGADGPPELSKNELRRREERRTRLEHRIAELEGELERMVAALQEASEAGNIKRIRALDADYQATQTDLEALLEQWGELA